MTAKPALDLTSLLGEEGVLILPHGAVGVVRMTGPDRLDFLHRLSTNDLVHLKSGQRRDTLLTNALGRMVDWVTVLCLPDRLLLVSSSGRASAVEAWLSGYVFFGDDVTIQATEGEWHLWGLYGPAAPQVVESAFSDGKLPQGEELQTSDGAMSWRTGRPTDGLMLLLPPERETAATKHWEFTAPLDARERTFERLRIAAGVPAWGTEISEEITPIEVNLDVFIDFEKGCYIGQEVIARMESRGRAPRRLTGLQMDRPAAAGAALKHEGRRVGIVTSSVSHAEEGGLGLALLDTRSAPPDEAELAIDGAGTARQRSLLWPQRG